MRQKLENLRLWRNCLQRCRLILVGPVQQCQMLKQNQLSSIDLHLHCSQPVKCQVLQLQAALKQDELKGLFRQVLYKSWKTWNCKAQGENLQKHPFWARYDAWLWVKCDILKSQTSVFWYHFLPLCDQFWYKCESWRHCVLIFLPSACQSDHIWTFKKRTILAFIYICFLKVFKIRHHNSETTNSFRLPYLGGDWRADATQKSSIFRLFLTRISNLSYPEKHQLVINYQAKWSSKGFL